VQGRCGAPYLLRCWVGGAAEPRVGRPAVHEGDDRPALFPATHTGTMPSEDRSCQKRRDFADVPLERRDLATVREARHEARAGCATPTAPDEPRFRLQRRDLPGRADVVFPGAGGRHKGLLLTPGTPPRLAETGPSPHPGGVWAAKLDRNLERDAENEAALRPVTVHWNRQSQSGASAPGTTHPSTREPLCSSLEVTRGW
jgi:hypothetical protein